LRLTVGSGRATIKVNLPPGVGDEGGKTMSIVNVASEQEFQALLSGGDKPVLFDFWAPWCGPCRMVGPEVEAVAEAMGDKAVVAKVNVDDLGGVAGKLSVMSVPTLLIFKGGVEKRRIVGFRPRKDIQTALEAEI
jgi:thioredoxin 1